MRDDPLFGVSQYTTMPLSFEQDIELYTRLGVSAIEVCEEKLSDDPGQAQDQLALVAESDLAVTSAQAYIHSPFPHAWTVEEDPKEPAGRFARLRKSIDRFTEAFAGQNLLMVSTSGAAPDGDFRLAHQLARQHYREVADYAADRGARIMYEPLSPVLMNTFSFICTLREAMQLIEDVDRPNFGLLLDVWHLWREPNIAENIAQLGDRIFCVHLGDWPVGEPRGSLDRVLPGQGLIDLAPMLKAIRSAGYDDVYCLEIFSSEEYPDSLWRADPAEVIETGREGFLKAWKSSN